MAAHKVGVADLYVSSLSLSFSFLLPSFSGLHWPLQLWMYCWPSHYLQRPSVNSGTYQPFPHSELFYCQELVCFCQFYSQDCQRPLFCSGCLWACQCMPLVYYSPYLTFLITPLDLQMHRGLSSLWARVGLWCRDAECVHPSSCQMEGWSCTYPLLEFDMTKLFFHLAYISLGLSAVQDSLANTPDSKKTKLSPSASMFSSFFPSSLIHLFLSSFLLPW